MGKHDPDASYQDRLWKPDYEIDYKASFFPDFTVTCDKCGSEKVRLRNDMGWSRLSGGWGGLYLHCDNCGSETEIYENI
jgi:hypothetical protein